MISSLANNIQFVNFIKSLKEDSPYLNTYKVITTNIKHNKNIRQCTVMPMQPLQLFLNHTDPPTKMQHTA